MYVGVELLMYNWLQVSRCVWREISVTCARRSFLLHRQLNTSVDSTPPRHYPPNCIIVDRWSLLPSAS